MRIPVQDLEKRSEEKAILLQGQTGIPIQMEQQLLVLAEETTREITTVEIFLLQETTELVLQMVRTEGLK